MDLNVFRDITYGMYVITTKYNGKMAGCIVNTVTQITSENPIISVSINKNNYTNNIIKESKKFALSILSEECKNDVIGKFGFYSSKDINKFENFKYEEIDNLPVLKENMCGYLICEVLNIIDAETHEIFLARVVNTKKKSNLKPMSYSYYHEVIKGKAPKNAPTYIEEKVSGGEKKMKKYQCTICGYIYDEEAEGVKFEDLPEDWVCPLCGVGKENFEEVK